MFVGVRKRLATLLIMVMPCLFAMAQTLRYDYDANGNRLTRSIVMSPNKAKASSINEFQHDSISDRDIRIYPNPTQGILQIKIWRYENDDSCDLYLFDISGRQVLSVPMRSNEAMIDINNQPNGIYVLRVILNSRELSWKIIKN